MGIKLVPMTPVGTGSVTEGDYAEENNPKCSVA
jgi:hypothetical protein